MVKNDRLLLKGAIMVWRQKRSKWYVVCTMGSKIKELRKLVIASLL